MIWEVDGPSDPCMQGPTTITETTTIVVLRCSQMRTLRWKVG